MKKSQKQQQYELARNLKRQLNDARREIKILQAEKANLHVATNNDMSRCLNTNDKVREELRIEREYIKTMKTRHDEAWTKVNTLIAFLEIVAFTCDSTVRGSVNRLIKELKP